MKAWITRGLSGVRFIWSAQPVLTGAEYDSDGDYVMSWLRDDQYPEHQPRGCECIEVDVDWLEVQG